MTSGKDTGPPRFFDRVLEWYCDERYLEEIQGALYEYFHEFRDTRGIGMARFLFALNVLSHFRPHLLKKSKKPQKFNIMLFNHLRISIRNLWKYRLNTMLNALGLIIGMTVFLLIMLWVHHETSFDGFHQKADRIYRISNTFQSESEQFSQAPSGPALGKRLPEDFAAITAGVRIGTNSAQIEIGNRVFYENNMLIVDPSFFDIFDSKVLSGNSETPFELLNSVVITASTAKKYFGDDNPIGQRMVADGEGNLVVSAVVADPPANSQQYSMLLSLELLKEMYNQQNMDDQWGGGWFHTYLLLEEGTDIAQLEEDINGHILTKLDWFTERNMSYHYFLQPLTSIHLHSDLRYDFPSNGSARNVFIFTAVGIIILLLACINYVNLSTATAINRAKEVGIKKVIGAPRKMLFFQHLIETLVVIMGATVVSLALVYLLIPYFQDFLDHPLSVPSIAAVVLPTMLGALVLGILTGLVPATIISAFRPLSVLKGAVKSGTSGRFVRRALVVVQFAASITLILAIITVQQQMRHVAKKDLGMAVDEVLHVNFRGVESVGGNREVLANELTKHPAIQRVSFQSRGYPVNGLSNGMVMVEKEEGNRVSSSLYHMWVDDQFVETFGIEMAAGRFYSRDFPADSSQSVVVNESAVRTFGWETPEAALGKEMGTPGNARRVIGVVKDFHFEGLQKSVEPVRILPLDGNKPGTLAIRANLQDPMDVLSHIEASWQSINPTVALDITFMDEDVRQQYKAELMFRSLFMLFSPLSLVIACLGLFGLAASSIGQRTKEVGIRKVLGASRMSLFQLLNREFVALIVLSLLISTPAAWYMMDQWLENFEYRISFQWYFVVIAGAITLALALLTSSYKAWWVSKTNPSHILRSE